ncbi:MAG TPA: (2Fe-2S)-binding protein [Candidatus Angelobacter sp.]|jgi:aerobic-type carbon monoxide dehydrogenase small subunit (CoxS/CutS family)|nr:(2Fe-2S)-binding protein [Candidatus Angelobacter sp.]
MHYRLNVNRHLYEAEVPSGTPLLSVLRDDLGLTGTRFGCGQGICGACYVLADGQPVPSCMISIEEAAEKSILTIEGLSSGSDLHRVQRAFLEEDAMQCGYCISGILISAAALLMKTPKPSEEQICQALAPHFCRCGIYLRIIRAVKRAAA